MMFTTATEIKLEQYPYIHRYVCTYKHRWGSGGEGEGKQNIYYLKNGQWI